MITKLEELLSYLSRVVFHSCTMMQTQNGAERAFEDEVGGFFEIFGTLNTNKAGYTTTEVACGLVGAIFEVT